MDRLEDGAVVEHGELVASVEVKPADYPTWEQLELCLEPELYAEIRRVYKPPSRRYLSIETRDGERLR